jgi:flagellar biosynthesis protein FlhG
MADLNLLLGVAPDKSLLDALHGTPIDEVLVRAHDIDLLPGLNGSYVLANLGPTARRDAFQLIESLSSRFDTLILDIAAGIGASTTAFAGAASEALVVVTPEPLSMADAYACLKVLRTEQGVEHAYLLPNRVASRDQADEIVASLVTLVDRFLDMRVTPLPFVPIDPRLADAARRGVPVVVDAPDAPSSRAIKHLARTLDALVGPERKPEAARKFWHRMFARAEGGTP